LKDVYGEREFSEKVSKLSDDRQMVEMANNLRGGVPMATPCI
jgi:DNA-directed RNA polymerase subunit beta